MRSLSRTEILDALHALARELSPTAPLQELVVAGGAAMVLLYNARESTKDVDAVVSSKELRHAAGRVAVKLGLPADWLNEGAKGYLHGMSSGEVVLSTPTLLVRALAVRQLLAMKLCAWRDDLDIADARLLLSKLTGDKDMAWKSVVPHLLPGRELKARLAFDDLWESQRGST